MTRRLVPWAFAAVVASSACSEPEVARLELVGSLAGEWTIDGVAPDAAGCGRAGLDEVRLSASEPGAAGFSRFTVRCSVGDLDTRPSRSLVAGRTYVVRLEGLRGGVVVSTGPERTVTVPPAGTHVVAPPWDIRTSGI